VSLDGKQAPAFELESTAGDTVSLAETLESGPTVVLVNRGHWCSFCAEQLQTFGEVADRYSGTEQTSHGLTGVAATYVVDTDGVVRYEQVADYPADRTHGNWVRYFVRNDFEDPFGE